MAASLPRSSVSFRRQGSSGLIWEDKLFSGELNQTRKKEEDSEEFRELRNCQSVGSIGMLERSRSAGLGRPSSKVSPAIDPPSPNISGCGFCGVFAKPNSSKQHKARPKRGKR